MILSQHKTGTTKIILLLMVLLPVFGFGQQVRVSLDPPDDSGFIEYVAYYLSGFDIQAGTSNFEFFKYRLVSNRYPADVKIEFTLKARSPSLGIPNAEQIMRVETNRFRMPSHPIQLNNRDLSNNTTFLYDQANPPNAIPVHVSTFMDAPKMDAYISSIITSGKIVDGDYIFTIKVRSGSPGSSLSSIHEITKTIRVQSPNSVQLQSPGGALADTVQNVIYSTYPLFMWNTDQCNTCQYFIRVAEFDRNRHSSLSEAIEDETMLPLVQSMEWAPTDVANSYQYPPSGTRPLLTGRIYVWQVRKTFLTTAGTEEILSSIYAIKIGDVSAPSGMQVALHPLLQSLAGSLSNSQYESFFGTGGALHEFIPEGPYLLNGNTIDENSVNYILSQIANNNVPVTGVRIE